MSVRLPERVQVLIDTLGLSPHPEGGWYRETYRGAPSGASTSARERSGESQSRDKSARGASTMIYFLLSSQDRSRFHRIDADEGWHHYEGDPVRVHILDRGEHRWLDVGQLDGEVTPQGVIPAGVWFGAEVLAGAHGYALVGCTVAPAFEFSRFELAERSTLLSEAPKHGVIIERLT